MATYCWQCGEKILDMGNVVATHECKPVPKLINEIVMRDYADFFEKIARELKRLEVKDAVSTIYIPVPQNPQKWELR
jgi:hypothetical protein